MPSRIAHVLDTVIIGVTTAVTASAPLLLATDPVANAVELQLFILPFVGALIVSGGMIMLNPQPEVRNIVIGRGIFALFFGILLPQVIAMVHPGLQTLLVKPAALVLFGGLIASLAYVISKPFCRELYQRADGIAKREAEKLEAKYSNPPENKP